MARLLREQADGVDAVALERARHQLAVRALRALEQPSRRLEAAALDLFALGRVRRARRGLAGAGRRSAPTQVRDAFATMLQGGASVAVAGKLRRGAEAELRRWAAPLLRR